MWISYDIFRLDVDLYPSGALVFSSNKVQSGVLMIGMPTEFEVLATGPVNKRREEKRRD